MSRNDEFDRLVRDWFADERGHAPTPTLRDRVITATASRRPRPAWIVALRGDAYGTAAGDRRESVGRPLMLALLVALLVAALVVGVVAIGSNQRPLVLAPTNPPSPSALAVIASPSAVPTPTAGPTATPAASPAASGAPHSGALAYDQAPLDPLSGDPGTLYIADPDGKKPRAVAIQVEDFLGWSASGSYLALDRPNADRTTSSISVITPSGTTIGTIDGGAVGEVDWSPTEDILLVISLVRDTAPLPHPRVALYRPDGSLVRELVPPVGVSELGQGAAWSPDGRSIVTGGCIGCHGTGKYDDTPDLIWDLWVINADGSGSTRITDTPQQAEVSPTWTPDGSAIAYWVACSIGTIGCPQGTWTIKPDGSGLHQLLTDGTNPIWSPDRARIAFSRIGIPVAGSGGIGHGDIVVANADGSKPKLIVPGPADDGPLAWSPDGRQILYVHIPAGSDPTVTVPRETWLIGADGSHPVKLGTQWFEAAWRPTP